MKSEHLLRGGEGNVWDDHGDVSNRQAGGYIFIFSSSSLYADIYCDGIRLNHTKPNLCPRPDRSFLGSRLIIPVPGPPGDLPLNGDFHEGHAGLML